MRSLRHPNSACAHSRARRGDENARVKRGRDQSDQSGRGALAGLDLKAGAHIAARRACSVRALRCAAVRAERGVRRLDRLMGATTAGTTGGAAERRNHVRCFRKARTTCPRGQVVRAFRKYRTWFLRSAAPPVVLAAVAPIRRSSRRTPRCARTAAPPSARTPRARRAATCARDCRSRPASRPPELGMRHPRERPRVFLSAHRPLPARSSSCPHGSGPPTRNRCDLVN